MLPEQKGRCVAVIESDPAWRKLLRSTMTKAGWKVILGIDDWDTFDLLNKNPDLIVIGQVRGEMSGEDVLQRMREFSWRSVIYLGDSDDPDYMARILEEGADRYFAKGPFNQELFVASAGAVIRRASIPTRNGQSDIFKNGGLAIDFRSREVTLEDREVPLTRTEYRLLTVLARNVGRIVTHDEILLQSWRGLGYRGDQFAYQTDDRHMLRVNICRVRGKLGENSQHPQYIINYPRVGYEMPRINNGDAQYQETL